MQTKIYIQYLQNLLLLALDKKFIDIEGDILQGNGENVKPNDVLSHKTKTKMLFLWSNNKVYQSKEKIKLRWISYSKINELCKSLSREIHYDKRGIIWYTINDKALNVLFFSRYIETLMQYENVWLYINICINRKIGK